MNYLDWSILIGYLLGLIVFGLYLSRSQFSIEDYYVASKNMRWYNIGLSTMATQLSAISFISAPAFVALKKNGGLIWLGYEFAVPFAVIIVGTIILPLFHRLRIISIYEYLELRFDAATRKFLSVVFQISRGLAGGVAIYAAAIVLGVMLGLELWQTILIIGIVTLIYDFLGGMKIVVYSDVIQMIILLLGIVICTITAFNALPDWGTISNIFPIERLKTINFVNTGLGDGNDFTFWSLLVGGFFLYISYYGCDQSQMQREISAKNLAEGQKSLLLNGVGRFPIVLSYCLMGIFVGTYFYLNPDMMKLVPPAKPDMMVPIFIINNLPNGVIGFLFVAILAAAMSSLDSTLNSLSATTMNDLVLPRLKRNNKYSDAKILLYSRLTTIFWGLFAICFAFMTGAISESVIVAINKIGSLFYGSIAATFLVGLLTKKAGGISVRIGIIAGVLFNFILWKFALGVSWLWWNFFGFAITFILAWIFGDNKKSSHEFNFSKAKDWIGSQRFWKKSVYLLFGFGIVIILITYGLSYLF